MAKRGVMLVALLTALQSACVSYIGIAKQDDRLYLTGSTSFWIFGYSWVKRCEEDAVSTRLRCEDLTVQDMASVAPRSAQGRVVNVVTPPVRIVTPDKGGATSADQDRSASDESAPSTDAFGPDAFSAEPVEQHTPPTTPPAPTGVSCQEIVGWLCGCESSLPDQARRSLCARARAAGARYKGDEDMCRKVTRGMIPMVQCNRERGG